MIVEPRSVAHHYLFHRNLSAGALFLDCGRGGGDIDKRRVGQTAEPGAECHIGLFEKETVFARSVAGEICLEESAVISEARRAADKAKVDARMAQISPEGLTARRIGWHRDVVGREVRPLPYGSVEIIVGRALHRAADTEGYLALLVEEKEARSARFVEIEIVARINNADKIAALRSGDSDRARGDIDSVDRVQNNDCAGTGCCQNQRGSDRQKCVSHIKLEFSVKTPAAPPGFTARAQIILLSSAGRAKSLQRLR